jgi:hypothetical protein
VSTVAFPSFPSQGSTSWYNWATAVHNTANSLAGREIDLQRDYGVVTGDSSTAVATANTTAINQALTDWISKGVTVVLPPGVTYINDAITSYSLAADTAADTCIRGAGPGLNSRIYQTDNTKDVFVVGTSTGNVRGLLFDNFEIWFGRRQFWLNRASYNFWRNVRQRQAQETAIYAEGGADANSFSQHWIYETPSGNAVNAAGACQLAFVNSTFGEMSGAIYCAGDISLVGCHGIAMFDRLDTNGLDNTGAAGLVCSSGRLQIIGGLYDMNAQTGIHMLYLGNLQSLEIVGARFIIAAGSNFMDVNIPTSLGYAVQIIGNTFEFSGDGALCLRTGANLVRQQWIGNKVSVATGHTVTIDDRLFNASYQNIWMGNDVQVH